MNNLLKESIQYLIDNKIEQAVNDRFGGSAITYTYTKGCEAELGKIFKDVIVAKTRDYVHIPSKMTDEQKEKLTKVVDNFKLKEM